MLLFKATQIHNSVYGTHTYTKQLKDLLKPSTRL